MGAVKARTNANMPAFSAASSQPALTTFHLFPHLPTELRLAIWQHAHPLFPRTLTLHHVPWNDILFPSPLPPNFRSSPKWTLQPSSIAPLLSVCSESRAEILPHYSLRFSKQGVAAGEGNKCQTPWEVPICLETDMLHVVLRKSVKVYDGTLSLFNDLFGDEAQVVACDLRRLAGSERFWKGVRDERCVDVFEGLEEAILVVPSRTMRMVGSMDVCARDAREVGVVRGGDRDGHGRKGEGFRMRMCAAGDLARDNGKRREVECDFMASGTDIYVFA